MRDRWPVAVIAAAVVTGVATVLVSTDDPPNHLALGLLQAITVGLSIWGSYIFGRNASRQAAQDILRPHARSSFRRVRTLYEAFSRLGTSIAGRLTILEAISNDNHGEVPIDHVRATMALLETQVFEQLGTANDALEDWRDIVPEEVEDVEARAAEQATGDDDA